MTARPSPPPTTSLRNSPLLGDTNLDNQVDLSDLSTVLNNFGQPSLSWTAGNFDYAPTIDLTDLSDVLNNFGANRRRPRQPPLHPDTPEPDTPPSSSSPLRPPPSSNAAADQTKSKLIPCLPSLRALNYPRGPTGNSPPEF